MWQVLIIICVCVVMYYRTIGYGYVIDDINMVLGKSSGNKWRDFWWGEVRGYYLFNSKREHSIILIIHTLNCILIYLALGTSAVSFLSALLFAVNPSNNQSAVWLSGRGYLYSTTIILLGMWLLPLFPFFYICTYWWASSTILTPLLFLFYPPSIYVLLLPMGMYLFRKNVRMVLNNRIKEATPLMKQLDWGKVVVAIKCYTYYFLLSLFPYRLGMYHTFCFTLGLSKEEDRKWKSMSPLFYVGCVLLTSFALILVYGNEEYRWGIIWFTLLIAQWCNLTTLYQPIAERYLYLPNIGVMYLLSSLILPHSILISIFLTAYVLRLYYYLPAYKDHLSLFKYNVENFPTLYNVYNSYGGELYIRGKIGAAIDVWIDGLQYNKEDFKLNSNLATALIKIGNVGMALHYYEQARKGINMNTDEGKLIPQIDKNIEDCKKIIGGTTSIPTSST